MAKVKELIEKFGPDSIELYWAGLVMGAMCGRNYFVNNHDISIDDVDVDALIESVLNNCVRSLPELEQFRYQQSKKLVFKPEPGEDMEAFKKRVEREVAKHKAPA